MVSFQVIVVRPVQNALRLLVQGVRNRRRKNEKRTYGRKDRREVWSCFY